MKLYLLLSSALLIWMSLGSSSASSYTADPWGVTKMKLSRAKFMWLINDFATFIKIGDFVESPLFYSTDGLYNWSLILYPNGQSEYSKNNIGVWLSDQYGDSSEDYSLHTLELSILNSTYQPVVTKTLATVYNLEDSMFGSANIISRSTVMNPESKILSNGTFIIYVSVVAYHGMFKTTGSCEMESLSLENVQYSDHYEKYWENKMFSDVKLAVGNQLIAAHKVVLASRSKFLEQALQSSSTIVVKNSTVDVTNEALLYMYTGRIINWDGFKKELVSFANEFQLDQLKSFVGSKVCQSLALNNAIEVLVYSDDYKIDPLKSVAVKLIASHAARFIRDPAFRELQNTHPHLVLAVLSAMVDNDSGSNSYSLVRVNDDLKKVLQILVYADDYDYEEIKAEVIDYIVKNINDFENGDVVIEDFSTSHPQLMAEISEASNML